MWFICRSTKPRGQFRWCGFDVEALIKTHGIIAVGHGRNVNFDDYFFGATVETFRSSGSIFKGFSLQSWRVTAAGGAVVAEKDILIEMNVQQTKKNVSTVKKS